MLKITTRIILILTVAALATACAAAPPPAPVEPAPMPVPHDPQAPTDAEIDAAIDQFFSIIVTAMDGQVPDYSADDVLELGIAMCQDLDDGMPVQQLVVSVIDAGLDPYFTGVVLAAAVQSFCLHHAGEVEAFLQAVSQAPSI